jgi:hypothetical protein
MKFDTANGHGATEVLKTNGRPESGWLTAPPRSGATSIPVHSNHTLRVRVSLWPTLKSANLIRLQLWPADFDFFFFVFFFFFGLGFSFKTLILFNILVYKDECEEFSYTLLCGNTSIHQPYFIYSAKFCTIEENKNIKGIFLLLFLGGGIAEFPRKKMENFSSHFFFNGGRGCSLTT